MSTNVAGDDPGARKHGVKSDADWFSQVSKSLYPTKTGLVLHYTTGLGDVRLCQKYASGDVRPPAFFLRALLRSGDGWQWLSASMDGATPAWWLDVQDAMKLKKAVDNR